MHTMIKRQHPITILYKMYRLIRGLIIPIALFIFNEIKADTGGQPYWVYFCAMIITVLICSWSLIAWFKDTYEVSGQALHVKYGVITATQRTIPLDNINSVNIDQNWLYRLLGIAKMEVRTADSNRNADAEIVVSKRMSQKLEKLLRIGLPDKLENNFQSNERITTNKELFMMSISLNAFWVGIPFVGTALQNVTKWIDQTDKSHGKEQLSVKKAITNHIWNEIDLVQFMIALIGLVAVCAVISWLISLLIIQIKYNGWRVERINNNITIQYGLFEKRIVQINVHKIKSIRIKERLFSRFFGYGSIWIDCVGYEGQNRMRIFIPALKKREMEQVICDLLPEFELTSELQPLQQGASFYYVFPSFISALVTTIISLIFYLPALWATPLLICLAVYKIYIYRNSKWGIYNNQFIISKAGLTKTTVYVLRKAVESITIRQNKLHRHWNIKSLEIDIDSPSSKDEYVLTGVNEEDILLALKWYKHKATNN